MQVLDLHAHAKPCVHKGDIVRVTVAYRTANGARTSMAAFRLRFDERLFSVVSATPSANSACPHPVTVPREDAPALLSASAAGSAQQKDAFVDYECRSASGEHIMPKADKQLLVVELRARVDTAQGATSVSLDAEAAPGFHTFVAPPLRLRYGFCAAPFWQAPMPWNGAVAVGQAATRR